MIISLRGPSGSGKSHLTRRVMSLFQTRSAITRERRLRPLGYLLSHEMNGHFLGEPGQLFVPGHYEIANGGVDTLPTLTDAYDMIRAYDESKVNVLYEGKCMSDGVTRALELHREGRDVRVVFLTTPTDECEASVRARGHRLARKSIDKVAAKCERDREKMFLVGMQTFKLSRDDALERVRVWLGV